MSNPRKASMGKRKLAIERGEKPVNIDVCFSKRRSGLFRKASELCILTGAQIAIITFSPHGNPFLFGHPCADSVIDHYCLNLNNGNTAPPPIVVHGGGGDTMISSSQEHAARLAEEIAARKVLLKKEKELVKREQETQAKAKGKGKAKAKEEEDYKEWFKVDHDPQENMTLEELESLRDEWMVIREKVVNQLVKIESSSSNSSIAAASSSYGGSSHDNNSSVVNGGFYYGSSSSSTSYYEPSCTTGFATTNNGGVLFHGDGADQKLKGLAIMEEAATNLTRHEEEVSAGKGGMDVYGDDCFDVFESLPPLLEEGYKFFSGEFF